MAEKMLVTQALDERDLLVKKIQDKIAKASFTDVKKHNEKKVIDRRVLEETFRQEAESAYQQIMDLIDRFQKIDAAIVASNAATMIHTSLTEIDMAAFAAYCQSFARWKEAQEHIDEEGSTFATDKGYQQQTPWGGIANTNQKLMEKPMTGTN